MVFSLPVEAVMMTTIELVQGLPRRELIERIHFHRRQGEVAERALGFYLLDMERSKAYRPQRDAACWARKNLECPRADKLILLAKRLEELPVISARARPATQAENERRAEILFLRGRRTRGSGTTPTHSRIGRDTRPPPPRRLIGR